MTNSPTTTVPDDNSRAVVVAAVVVSLVLGALTAFGQQHLSDQWRPVANSAGSWTLIAFALAWFAHKQVTAIATGAMVLIGLLAGYGFASELRGFAFSSAMVVFWLAASVTVGPVIGYGASLVRGSDDRLAAAGVSLMSGVLLGEGAYGLTVVADTTEPHWWVTEILTGLVLCHRNTDATPV
ncbi:MAG: hypothetical protein JWP10_457 [Nocardioidaceae bacterium]|nr:hypothetical protein [Nocardioidaceae bacterium]